MARVIHTGSTPAKRRNAHMRTCAELLHLLSEKIHLDDEAKDMAASFVYSLRGIYETIKHSADVWDEKGYWERAEELRNQWLWSKRAADEIASLIAREQWHKIPEKMINLLPHFRHINVATITRNADHWCGALKALLNHDRPKP